VLLKFCWAPKVDAQLTRGLLSAKTATRQADDDALVKPGIAHDVIEFADDVLLDRLLVRLALDCQLVSRQRVALLGQYVDLVPATGASGQDDVRSHVIAMLREVRRDSLLQSPSSVGPRRAHTRPPADARKFVVQDLIGDIRDGLYLSDIDGERGGGFVP
jgi:hypothetical protein